MTQPLTKGEKNRRANIRQMKALGAKNAKLRSAQKVERYLAHVERNNAAAEKAARERAARIARHEETNRSVAEHAQWERDAKKAIAAREAAGIPSIATMLASNDAETVADMLLGGVYGDLPMAA